MPPRRGRPAIARDFHYQAPTGGINTVAPGLGMPITDCVSAFNLVGAENGLRTRSGYREFCIGVPGGSVRTVIPFTGGVAGSSRLFVATNAGIYDVTSGSPVLQVAFSLAYGTAGYGVSANFVTSGGRFVIYADDMNGLHVYSDASQSWVKPTLGSGPSQISGVDPARIVFVAVFKNSLWFVERDTSDGWYLPAGQVFGAAQSIPFGRVFREGGSLVGLWNWTYDGGAGLDDSLVVISSGGDVAVYQGTDPSSPSTFGLRGVWQMSKPPAGRRIASTYGGDLLLLSRQGILPMSQLVVGSVSSAEYATAKVANLLNTLMNERATDPYWGIFVQPEDNVLMLLIPEASTGIPLQLVQSNAGRGWFPYKDIPIRSGAVWQGQFYFGTTDGRVCIHTGHVDNVSLATPSTFDPIDWGFLGAFSNYGAPRQKTISLLRPIFLSDGIDPSYTVAARFDYDTTDLDPVGVVLAARGAAWDDANWDADVWGGLLPPLVLASGALGMGSSVAVAMRGRSMARTVLVGVDVVFQQGGVL